MAEPADAPYQLELAVLPREQIGPFLILGVDKDASTEEIQAHWAQRLIWARARQIRTPLEDVNWAKELLNDRERRVAADVSSMNADTLPGEFRQLLEKHGPLEPEVPGWKPVEPPLVDLPEIPSEMLPDLATLQAAVTVPEPLWEFPGVPRILAEAVSAPLDPWLE